jgi:two-component system response regulator MprA
MSGRILVIDDDEKITSLLKRGLVFEGYTAITFNDAALGLKSLMQQVPDLIILDIMMPQIDGWEICRRVRAADLSVPILMLTAKDEVADRVKGLDLGADDYLVKPFALDELFARVRALLRRMRDDHHGQGANELSFKDLTMDLDSRQVHRAGKEIELTAKEFDLLHLFMQNPRRVLSRDLIMEKIWGYDYSGESNVLEVYIAMLRQKTEGSSSKRLIQTVRGAGYVLRGDS